MKVRGRVKWFNVRKGYGFIEVEGGEDVFVHFSSIADGVRTLQEGDDVEFDVTPGTSGPRAENVTRFHAAALSPSGS